MYYKSYISSLQACTNPAVKYAVYDGSVQGGITANAVQSPAAGITTLTTIKPTVSTDACQDVTAVKDHQTYSMEITSPPSLADKQARCEKIKSQLEKRNKIKGFLSYTNNKSCETNGDAVTFHARLNEMSLTYVSLYISHNTIIVANSYVLLYCMQQSNLFFSFLLCRCVVKVE